MVQSFGETVGRWFGGVGLGWVGVGWVKFFVWRVLLCGDRLGVAVGVGVELSWLTGI